MNEDGAITLTATQFGVAAWVGLQRFTISKLRGVQERAPRPHDDWLPRLHDETLGVCGEIAVALALGVPWAGSIDTFHVPDVGDVDVRTTARDNGSLLVYPGDPINRWVILVTGEPPAMRIRGCMWVADARRPEWWRDPNGIGGAWFVPQEALRPWRARNGNE